MLMQQSNKAQLLTKMIELSVPVIKNYWSDLFHDASDITNSERGTIFLWAPYSSGTRLIVLQRNGKPNIKSLPLFDAMSPHTLTDKWYRIEIFETDTLIEEIDTETARALAYNSARESERTTEHVNEIHL